MLQYIEAAAFSDNSEVSGGALESFCELLEACPEIRAENPEIGKETLLPALNAAWLMWINIARVSTS